MRIVYTRADGRVCVVHAATKESLEQVLGPLTDKQYIEHVYNRSIPPDASNVIETDDIPTDRTYRDAWTMAGGKIVHDMDKCREIHRTRLKVAAIRQGKRDVSDHPDIDAARTPEELKAVWPL